MLLIPTMETQTTIQVETQTTIQDRLKGVMQYYGLNINSLTRQIGLENNTTIGQIMNMPGRYPSFMLIERILESFPRLNARWFVTGKGTMFSEEEDFLPNSRDRVLHIMNKYRHSVPQVSIKTNIQASELEEIVSKGAQPTFRMLELICEGYHDLNPEWIMKNSGKMFKNGPLI